MHRTDPDGEGPAGWRRRTADPFGAALAGLGPALAPSALVAADLAAGRLARLANEEWKCVVGGMDEIVGEIKAEPPTLQRFKSWLRAAL